MNADIPDIDEGAKGPDPYEFRILEAEARATENLNREADQKFWLRWLVGITSVGLVIAMGILLAFVVFRLIVGDGNRPPPSVQMAVYMAPIASLTAMTIALLIAVFRGYREADDKVAKSGLREITRQASESTAG